MKVRPGVEVAYLTDVGRVRSNNEDSLAYWEPASDSDFQRKGRLAIVADGMGGYEGGQEASRLAVEIVRDIYDRSFTGGSQQTLNSAFVAAHQKIQSHAGQNPELHGMGTTCTAVALVGSQLFFAHVGDSRVYLVREQNVSRLTRDHSYVGRLVESGIVRSEDAETHPQRHILTAALGSGREVDPDFPEHALTLQNGDALVLCTDGLWSMVGELEIAAAVRTNTPADACTALVKSALDRGGPDNVTLIVLQISA